MHQENCIFGHFQFDDQALDASVEIMKFLTMYAARREKGITLFADDGQNLIKRFLSVFSLVGGIHTQVGRNSLRLIDHATTDRACVDLNQTNNVRIDGLYKFGDIREYRLVAKNVACARQGHVQAGTPANGVSYVVLEEAHGVHTIPNRACQCYARSTLLLVKLVH